MSNSFNLIVSTLGKSFEIQQYFALINTESFRNEIKKDLQLISKKVQNPDRFFEEHARYILNLNFEQRQKIGLEMWLSLLDIIKSVDEPIYKSMHKGTAFYHTGVMYLLNDRWIDGLEWLDYAFEQDTKNKTKGIVERPATWTLSFDPRTTEQKRPNDFGISNNVEEYMKELFKDINKIDSNFNTAIDDFRKKIKSTFLDASSNRSIRSAWCTFLGNLMNKKHILRYLRLGPKERCIQVTAHKSFVELTLILETLLQNKYSGTNSKPTLGTYMIEVVAKQVFSKNITKVELISGTLTPDYTKILPDIQKAEKTNGKLEVAYQLAYEVRNHSHHLFNEEEISEDVFNQIFLRLSYAIIMTITILY